MRLVWLIALLGACGGSGAASLDGVYQATSDDEDPIGCGAGTPSGALPIFRLETGSFLGMSSVKYELCTSTDAGSCLDLGALSIRFTMPTADGWTDDSYGGTTTSGGCLLTRSTSTVTAAGKDGVHVVFEKDSVPAAPNDSCTPTAARALAATMTCSSREELLAVRVP